VIRRFTLADRLFGEGKAVANACHEPQVSEHASQVAPAQRRRLRPAR
jgi:hypothetical protein